MKVSFVSKSAKETRNLAWKLGQRLKGGEVFEFSSDLGGGKTTFVKGLVSGFGSTSEVASPSFTVSFTYDRPDGRQFHHFDFYRLSDPGIVKNELAEVVTNAEDVVAVEWGETVNDVLPDDTITVHIKALGEDEREISLSLPNEKKYLVEGMSV